MEYSQLNPTSQNLLINSTDKSNWSWMYNQNVAGEITTENEIQLPEVFAMPGCDFSESFVQTTFSNGDISFKLNIPFNPNFIEWHFL